MGKETIGTKYTMSLYKIGSSHYKMERPLTVLDLIIEDLEMIHLGEIQKCIILILTDPITITMKRANNLDPHPIGAIRFGVFPKATRVSKDP